MSVLGMVIGAVPLKSPMLGSFLGLWLIIPWLLLVRGDLPVAALAVGNNALLMLGMIPEIRRMLALRAAGHDVGRMARMTDVPMGRMIDRLVRRVGSAVSPRDRDA
jgi:hypothetical protein